MTRHVMLNQVQDDKWGKMLRGKKPPEASSLLYCLPGCTACPVVPQYESYGESLTSALVIVRSLAAVVALRSSRYWSSRWRMASKASAK